MRHSGVLLVLVAALACAALGEKTTGSLDDLKKPVVLTSKDFKLFVLKSKIPWVLFFQKGSEVPAAAEALATELDAVSRVGIINTASKKDSPLAEMNLKAEDAPAYRAYGYGEDKANGFKDFESVEEAKKYVVESLPADLVKTIKSQADFEPFLVDSSLEEKISTVLFTDKEGIPDLMKKLALWIGDKYSFAVFPNAPTETAKQLGADSLPQLILMVPQLRPENPGQLAFGSVPYDRKNFGGLKFKNAIRFLATVAAELEQSGTLKQAFEALDGKNKGKKSGGKKAKEPEPEPASFEIKEIFEVTSETPDYCSESKLGLCIVAFLDGSPQNAEKEAQLKVLRDVQHSPANKGRALHFMWVDVTCHSSFGQAFDVAPDTAPIVVAISGKKKAFAKFVGSYSTKELDTFVTGVLSGKIRIAPLQTFPTVPESEDCAAIHAQATAPVEEEVDLADILNEDVGEDVSKKIDADADAKEDASAIEEAEKRELEQKRKKAMEEIEKLNKASNAGKGRRRRRRSKKSKDEL